MRPARLALPLLLLLLSLVAWALAGCGDGCPEPLFADPTIPDGIQSSADGDVVVVRWPASAGDVLPDGYYETMSARELAPPITAVEPTAPRELTVTLSSSGAVRTTSRELVVSFDMDDTNRWTDCSHPGMSDTYHVTLTLSFDGRGGVTASFSEVGASLGACSAAPGGPSAPPWSGAVVFAIVLLVRARRRRGGGGARGR